VNRKRRRASVQAALLMGVLMMSAQCSTKSTDIEPPTLSTLPSRAGATGKLEFAGFGPHPDEPIDVYSYMPDTDLSEAPILVVMPGRGRNAQEYRDEWLEEARERRLILLVPEFPGDLYSVAEYNLGNLEASGRTVPSDRWTFNVLEGLVAEVTRQVNGRQTGYYLYGHSAGAQFVHRFMMFMADNQVIRAVSANAGWYTAPDPLAPFPYGLKDSPASDDDSVARMLASPLTVLVGSDDNDPDADGLRDDKGSRRQGSTRLERGFFFYQSGLNASAELAVEFGWKIDVVPGAGHYNSEMVAAAAAVMFR